jgi:polynucleotide 5'-hydroxyl-kinase GRC3/NOL9
MVGSAEGGPGSRFDVPPAWKRITLSALGGTVLVVGAPDTGKSTFARYLYRRLCGCHQRVGFIDGDMGQATLGPPTTISLALSESGGGDDFPPLGPRFCVFIGDVSPRGHMLPTVVGAHRLVQKAEEEGATAVVFDTTGLVDPSCGGGELKRAKIDLLRPSTVVGIQRGDELEHLLVPLRRSRRTRVLDLQVSWAARRREVAERQNHRCVRFRRYFEEAQLLEVAWQRWAVLPAPSFTPLRLVAFECAEGFTLGLGIVVASDRHRATLTVKTPLTSADSLDEVDTIRLGDVALDPLTFRELRLRQ